MQEARTAVSRIEFRTNLMRATAPVIRLGYLVECCWEDARWMGLVYRTNLTHNELRESNTDTWPELSAPEALLRNLFDAAWDSADGEGGAALQARYGGLSALRVVVEDAASNFAAGISSEDDAEVDDQLYTRLRRFEQQLEPVCAAEVIAFATPGSAGARMVKLGHRTDVAA